MILTGCTTPSGPRFPTAADRPPPHVDASLCTTVERPSPPPRKASFVEAVTPAEKAATDAWLTWSAGVTANARKNAARAELARKTLCD
jgi:hypothetical protein